MLVRSLEDPPITKFQNGRLSTLSNLDPNKSIIAVVSPPLIPIRNVILVPLKNPFNPIVFQISCFKQKIDFVYQIGFISVSFLVLRTYKGVVKNANPAETNIFEQTILVFKEF